MIELDESPAMVTVGASLFADALTAQVATPRQVQWSPPVPGSEADLVAVAADVRTHVGDVRVGSATDRRQSTLGGRAPGPRGPEPRAP